LKSEIFRQLPKPSPKRGFDEGLKSERLTVVRRLRQQAHGNRLVIGGNRG
jgi:hypothetical protein